MASETRDIRLDFFRGLALLFIFIDHIPGNAFSYLTLANIVFSDAAEIFVFISGYTAAAVFGALMRREGIVFAGVQILRRGWTLYIAHIFVFVIFTAQVSWTAQRFANPMFVDEMNVASFLQEPHIAVFEALILRFQPAFMNILPLYIVLLIGLALLLPVLRDTKAAVLGIAGAIYLAVQLFHFNPSTYPDGVWYFNPFAWQALFLIGATLGFASLDGVPAFFRRRYFVHASASFLALAVAIKAPLTVLDLLEISPGYLAGWIWMFADKTNLGPLRLLNFLALAHVTLAVFKREHGAFRSRWAAPVVCCGQNSLDIFCLGIFLSYFAHLALVETEHTLAAQLAANAIGIAIMFLAAQFLNWSKARPRLQAIAATSASEKAPQGGE